MVLLTVTKKIGDSVLIGRGVVFLSGKIVVEWEGKITSIVIYNSLKEFESVNQDAEINFL